MFFYNDSATFPYANRIDAILAPDPCFFYFHDNEFKNYHWTVEPKKSLKELYKERAEQIRKDYEYVILAYSGGHDSHNILESFYFNNIHIDEILMVGAFSQDSEKGSDENHNGEIYNMAYPTVKNLNLPNTKLTLFDYTTLFDNINNFPILTNHGSDWPKYIGSYFSVHTFFWNNIKQFIGKNNDKKTALIFGIDKPNFQFDYKERRPYTQFRDTPINAYGGFKNYDNYERINFYHAVDAQELQRKQLHIISNFFIENCIVKENINFSLFFKHYEKIIHKLIYQFNIPITYKSEKSPNNIISLRDQYLYNAKNSDIFKLYKEGVKKVPFYSLGKNIFKTDFISRRYYLTDEKIIDLS